MTDKQIVITVLPCKIKPEKTAALSAASLPLHPLSVSNVNSGGLVFHGVKRMELCYVMANLDHRIIE